MKIQISMDVVHIILHYADYEIVNRQIVKRNHALKDMLKCRVEDSEPLYHRGLSPLDRYISSMSICIMHPHLQIYKTVHWYSSSQPRSMDLDWYSNNRIFARDDCNSDYCLRDSDYHSGYCHSDFDALL
jgi:hypothetical protein